jgi:hypothetical protein
MFPLVSPSLIEPDPTLNQTPIVMVDVIHYGVVNDAIRMSI